MPRAKKQPYPLPRSETRDLAQAEKTILLSLADGDKRAKVLRERAQVKQPTLYKHLNRLVREGRIEKSSDTGAYHITETGLRAISRYRITDATKLNFVDGMQKGEPIPFLIVAGFAENVANSDLQALMRYRSETALYQWVRDILGLARSKQILPDEYFNGTKQWDEITQEQWSRIQKEVLSNVGDVGYAEDVTPKDLIAELMKPESKQMLCKMSESSQVVPDFRNYLAYISKVQEG